jgi:GT2 family glycosyltransferase
VVIPSRDRPRQLAETVAAVLAQRGAETCELIVVDDGSSPALDNPQPERVRLLRQTGRGPAAARNLALGTVRAPRVWLLGDDTPPAPGALARHLAVEASGVAVQGRIDWHPGRPITALMEFLAPAGPQFYFASLRPGAAIPYTAMLGSNLSLPAEWLRQEPFDERFGGAAFEDTELAYRFARRGWRVVYDPGAQCWHDHPYHDIESFAARQRRAGAAARLAVRLHPRMAAATVLLPSLVMARTAARLVASRLGLAPRRQRDNWDWRCRAAFLSGFLRAC